MFQRLCRSPEDLARAIAFNEACAFCAYAKGDCQGDCCLDLDGGEACARGIAELLKSEFRERDGALDTEPGAPQAVEWAKEEKPGAKGKKDSRKASRKDRKDKKADRRDSRRPDSVPVPGRDLGQNFNQDPVPNPVPNPVPGRDSNSVSDQDPVPNPVPCQNPNQDLGQNLNQVPVPPSVPLPGPAPSAPPAWEPLPDPGFSPDPEFPAGDPADEIALGSEAGGKPPCGKPQKPYNRGRDRRKRGTRAETPSKGETRPEGEKTGAFFFRSQGLSLEKARKSETGERFEKSETWERFENGQAGEIPSRENSESPGPEIPLRGNSEGDRGKEPGIPSRENSEGAGPERAPGGLAQEQDAPEVV